MTTLKSAQFVYIEAEHTLAVKIDDYITVARYPFYLKPFYRPPAQSMVTTNSILFLFHQKKENIKISAVLKECWLSN